jgi:hypothetical protein
MKDWIFNYRIDLDINAKLFIISNFIVSVTCFIGFVGNYFLGLASELVLLTFVMFVISGMMFYYVRGLKKWDCY